MSLRQHHIVHLSSVHRATDTRVFHKECVSLSQAGFRVTLVARADADYEQSGVSVLAVRSGDGNRFVRMTRTVLEVYRKALAAKGDAYHLHDAELLPIGVLLRLMGKAVVYDAHEDLVGQIKSKSWIPHGIRHVVAGLMGIVESACARFFTMIVIANPLQGERFPPHRTLAIQNFPLLAEADAFGGVDYATREQSAFYVGGLSEIRGVRQMVDAMEIVNRRRPARLILGGAFSPPALEGEVSKSPGWRATEFLGWLSRDDVVSQLRRTRVGLVVVHPVPNYESNQPVKLFEYMMAGIPVICSDICNYRQFVSDLGTGLMVDPLDPESIAEAVLRILDDPAEAEKMGRVGREAVLKQFNWRPEADKLIGMYSRIFDVS